MIKYVISIFQNYEKRLEAGRGISEVPSQRDKNQMYSHHLFQFFLKCKKSHVSVSRSLIPSLLLLPALSLNKNTYIYRKFRST
ncbi:hypothetical protein CEY12_16525 [Chryseobacterium sp. T16E-39]|nr:hypothetical protein CEY12_16525 [Chryseobacterium sp. T16E-39]